jgi:hypothetical protein
VFDLRRIVKACPVFESLQLRDSVQLGADLSPLLRLPESFTSLQGAGPALTDAAVPVVAQLTQLRHLSWEFSEGLTDTGLEQLAGLDLATLHLSECGLSDEVVAPRGGDVELVSKQELVSAAGLHQVQQPLTVVHVGKLGYSYTRCPHMLKSR